MCLCSLPWFGGDVANKAARDRSILCSDYAIKRIDEPFVRADDQLAEWAL